jgi:hypothetical protein
MFIDGEQIAPNSYYRFSSVGEHTVQIIMDTSKVTNMNSMFRDCSGLTSIDFGYKADVPKVTSYSSMFYNVPTSCTLTLCNNTKDSWNKIISSYTLNVVESECYTPTACTSLNITALDVKGKATSTTISYTAVTNGVDIEGAEVTNVTMTGTFESDPFEQNTDTANTITRTITFEYLGVTASTTFIQKAWVDQQYSINLNNQWQLSTSYSNFDSLTYDGIYESFSNKGVPSSSANCIITIEGYENFTLYIGSYAESSYDYTIAFNVDSTIIEKVTTKSFQYSPTSISNFKKVEYTNLDGGVHTIQITYKKDGSDNSNNDRGYLLIPKNQ